MKPLSSDGPLDCGSPLPLFCKTACCLGGSRQAVRNKAAAGCRSPKSLTSLLATVLLFAGLHHTDAAPKAQKTPSPEQMRKLLEQTRPGPEHELLAKFAGKWKLTIKAGQGAQSPGRANSYMTLENRFLWIGYSTDRKQNPFKGSFQIGFDRRHGMFNLIAMDNSGTYFVTSRGKLDPKTRKARLLGKDDDPYMKSLGFTKEFAHILDFSRPDRFVITVMFIDTRTPARKESKGMELIFERLKNQ